MQNLFLLSLLIMSTSCTATGLVRGGYEEASHKVLQSEGPVQLREYPELQLIQTEMKDTQDNGFMRLFRYIDKGNEREEKIAMTTPVFVEMENQTKKMSFVLPATMEAEKVPAPVNPQLSHVQSQPGLFATYRYNGRVNVAPKDVYTKLEAWMKANGYEQNGEEIHAFYDPPWTPAPMRRNELLIPVIKTAEKADRK